MSMENRLQKILSQAGIASRRKAEELIAEGRVTVNGQIAHIGMKADPSRDHIKIDGKLISRPDPKVYLIFYKPRGVVTSLRDPEGRPTVRDYLKRVKYRVFPVGRLDYDSEGLLIMTNDGNFAHSILHPSKKIPKSYLVKVKGEPDEAALRGLRQGIRLEDGVTAPASLKKIRVTANNTWLEVTIREGRRRQIRRMLEQTGHPVLKLKRIRIDGIGLGNLKPGEYRYLRPQEVSRMKSELAVDA